MSRGKAGANHSTKCFKGFYYFSKNPLIFLLGAKFLQASPGFKGIRRFSQNTLNLTGSPVLIFARAFLGRDFICSVVVDLRLFFAAAFLAVFAAFSPALASCFWEKSPREVDSSLLHLHSDKDYCSRIASVARMRIGTPYRLGPLGEGDSRGPLFTVSETDCTVFVLTTLALAHDCSYDRAVALMKRLNYHNPPLPGREPVSYGNRLHFTYDRLWTCPYFSDITGMLVPPDRLRVRDIVLNRKSGGGELLPISWSKRVRARYIPMKFVTRELLSGITQKAAGVGFVREKSFGLGVFIAHEGLVLDGRRLVHADSVAGKVVEADFLGYCSENSDYFDGIVISRFNY